MYVEDDVKQVAQRAMIVHLSPMCHGHLISKNINGPWKPEARNRIELIRDLMPVLVTSYFDDDSIKNERANMKTAFSHYKSKGNFLDTQWQLTP